MKVRTQQNDTVDLLCWRHLGITAGMVEETLALNPGLSAHGPILPQGILVELPEPVTGTVPTNMVQLWD